MAKFLLEARYTSEGARGLAHSGGSARRTAVSKMLESVGGKLEAFYFAFGDVDAYAIFEVPDSATAAAVALAVDQGGAATTRTIALLSPEEMDSATKKSVSYQPPT